ncbi:MAG: hypothetical protein RR854_00305 [Muribaculaceae bacterium]
MTKNSINIEISSYGYLLTVLGEDGFKASGLWSILPLGLKWANAVLNSHKLKS